MIKLEEQNGQFIRYYQKKVLNGKFRNTRPVGKPTKKMGGCRPEGNITDPRKTRMEETARTQI